MHFQFVQHNLKLKPLPLPFTSSLPSTFQFISGSLNCRKEMFHTLLTNCNPFWCGDGKSHTAELWDSTNLLFWMDFTNSPIYLTTLISMLIWCFFLTWCVKSYLRSWYSSLLISDSTDLKIGNESPVKWQ